MKYKRGMLVYCFVNNLPIIYKVFRFNPEDYSFIWVETLESVEKIKLPITSFRPLPIQIGDIVKTNKTSIKISGIVHENPSPVIIYDMVGGAGGFQIRFDLLLPQLTKF